jgi:hypothetical protein
MGGEEILHDILVVFVPADLLKPKVELVHCDEWLGVLLR